MPLPLDRLDRIENVVGVGTPDVNFCIQGKDGWIEMKSPKEPVYSTSKLFRFKNNHKLNQDQKNWFLRQTNAGGRAFILICTPIRWMLLDGSWADDINDMTVDQLWETACWKCDKPISSVAWQLLRTALQGGRP
ncbi:hypothetical protein KAR91_21415 [Candidatus Pacearchaeota archaeon]|nr:hypothetical protein [Candidatus Pacearchaeota archaeon]